MTAAWLLSWWNLIFIVPFLLALVYLGVYAASGWTFGEDFDADHDLAVEHDVTVEHDVDLDHDVAVEHDADIDHDATVDADHDVDHDAVHDTEHGAVTHGGSVSPHMALLMWLGVGRVPLGLVLMVLLLTWGAVGFMANNIARPLLPAEWMVGFISLPVALLGSMTITRSVTRLVGKYMPMTETSAKRRDAVLGQVGEAIYAIDDRFGLVSLRDKAHGVSQVPCRTGADCAPIAKGSAVLLVGYDANDRIFTVIPYELGGDSATRKALTAGNGNGKQRPL